MQLEIVSNHEPEIVPELRSLAARIGRLGPQVEATSPVSVRDYLALSRPEQEKVRKNIDALDEVLLCFGEGQADTRRAAKRALDKYKMRVRDEDIDLIMQDDVVEMYSIDGLQIFRNLEFFNYCRYSLLEVMMYEWFALYERASFVEKDLHQWQVDVLKGATSKKCFFGENFMRERLLADKRLYAIQFKYLIPLFDQVGDEIQGLMLTSSGTPVTDIDVSNLRFI
ncbi:MAG: hypothetical protein ABIR96_09630 [Bdellovibrionota bacterium]